jgi:UDP-galactopyranose mutase
MKFCIVGAGFAGSVLARELANESHDIFIYDSRSHIGGNCYTERDIETNILIHKYGPHLFHTENKKVWDYINQFSEFIPFSHKVKVTTQGRVYSLPINLLTINQFFGKTFNPSEAYNYLQELSDYSIVNPISFEEQALKFIGSQLYEAFFKGYTLKQWGIDPKELPSSILKRLPINFNYNDNYFNHPFQGMPVNGYTPIFENILNHKNISLFLNYSFNKEEAEQFDHVFYTGPIDSWFNHSEGYLSYRTLDFQREVHTGDYQGCSVMNYSDLNIPYTRITEHKHFSPWETHSKTVIYKEFSRKADINDIPYYPIRLVHDKSLLNCYTKMALESDNVSFLGRLGTYKYLDMDVTIAESLNASQIIRESIKYNKVIPVFFNDVI